MPLKASDVTLLQLRDAVLCVQCELISYNNTTNCLACGSSAVMNLSRVLGGSLRDQQTANIIDDETFGKIVEDTLDWIPLVPSELVQPVAARNTNEQGTPSTGGFLDLPRLNPIPAMQRVVERAFSFTRAHGAALALWHGTRMVCQASAGDAAPTLGSEVQLDTGLAGLCVRTGQAWRCDDAATDPNVNIEACRSLGIRSVIAAPLNQLNRVLGILQVLSAEAFAFDDHDVATVQLLSQMMVMAFSRRPPRHAEAQLPHGMKLGFAGASLQ
jgi:GAF domain-containing protein